MESLLEPEQSGSLNKSGSVYVLSDTGESFVSIYLNVNLIRFCSFKKSDPLIKFYPKIIDGI